MTVKRGIDYINNADLGVADLTASAQVLRDKVIHALVEYLSYGARVRPITVGGRVWCYARALRASEREWLARMHPEMVPYLRAILATATTLPPEEISNLSLCEFKHLLNILIQLNQHDDMLLPWVLPFTTTSLSIRLFASHLPPTSAILTPQGVMPTVGLSEIYTHWMFLSDRRAELLQDLKDTHNAALILKGQVGNKAQSLMTSITNLQKKYASDSPLPWAEMSVVATSVDLNDGWGHIREDSSAAGLIREYNGMLNNDKHEQLMTQIMETQQRQIWEEQQRIKGLKQQLEGVTVQDRALSPQEIQQNEKKQKQRKQENQKSREQTMAAKEGGRFSHFK